MQYPLFLALLGVITAPAISAKIEPTRIVALHNRERAAVGSPPLAWSDALAADAAVWADALARAGRMRHDPQNRAEGENIWMGTRGAYSLDQMIGGWAAEKADLPDPRRWFERHGAVGHYTQMIWSTTTLVGCAATADRDADYLVCRYSPPGNIVGRPPY